MWQSNGKSIFDMVKSLSIVEVIEKFSSVKLKPSGNSLQGLCPLHNEKSPSFSVQEDKGIFKCFGCGIGGDAVTFVQALKGYENSKTAAIEIANSFGLQIDEEKFDDHFGQKNAAMWICNKTAQEHYTQSLLELKGEIGAAVKGYIAKRLNISDKERIVNIINEFGIGWCDASSEPKWEKEIALECGLIGATNNQTFRNRVVVSIKNKQGKICGFGGRILPQLQQDPKYLNTKENSVFKKQDLLFGLHESLAKVKEKRGWFLTESYFDVINLHARGVKAAVANMGTAMTEKQVDLLLNTRKVDGIVIIAHNDQNNAGLKSAIKSYELFVKRGANVSICLPKNPYKDIGEIFEQHKIGFAELANDYLVQISYSDAQKAVGVSEEEMLLAGLRVAKKISSPLSQDKFLEDLSVQTGYNKMVLKKEMSRL